MHIAIPSEGDGLTSGNVNTQKMYMAAKLSVQMRRLFKQWNAKTLTLDELEEKSQKWFMNAERREGFLIIIFRARRRKIDILYGPGAPRFQLTYRIQLFNDITERIRELHESLSSFAFLVGDDYSEGESKKTSRRTSLGEAFEW